MVVPAGTGQEDTKQLPCGWGARDVIRREFRSRAGVTSNEEIQSLVDYAFDALRQVNYRVEQLESSHWKPRPSEVDMAVGMVGQHQRYLYRLVIIGWDSYCTKDDLWIRAMGVDRLKHGRDQPFYYCLADVRDRPEGNITYVAQENILPLTGRSMEPVMHPLIESMFSDYSPGEGYVAVKDLRQRYPEDVLPMVDEEEMASERLQAAVPQLASTDSVVAPETSMMTIMDAASMVPGMRRAAASENRWAGVEGQRRGTDSHISSRSER